MTARPVLFSEQMVRALLDGRKTQTRRVVKWKPRVAGYNLNFSGVEAGYYCGSDPASGWVLRSREGAGGCWNDRTWPTHCAHGKPGDLLWVRETWGEFVRRQGEPVYRADNPDALGSSNPWRPSIHMQRKHSRLTLKITDVRVERLQSISSADAIAEGIAPRANITTIDCDTPDPRLEYASLWDSLNFKRGFGWGLNPWVWVLTFTVDKRNVDDVLRDAKAAA